MTGMETRVAGDCWLVSRVVATAIIVAACPPPPATWILAPLRISIYDIWPQVNPHYSATVLRNTRRPTTSFELDSLWPYCIDKCSKTASIVSEQRVYEIRHRLLIAYD